MLVYDCSLPCKLSVDGRSAVIYAAVNPGNELSFSLTVPAFLPVEARRHGALPRFPESLLPVLGLPAPRRRVLGAGESSARRELGMSVPLFFHVDLDAFFASVEQLDDPSLAGKPVIVGAEPGHRGVVSTCSYEARAYGVRSAMPISEAWRRCPGGVYLRPRIKRYAELSAEVMETLGSFSPGLRQLSIDEALLDMTGTERLWGAARSGRPPRQGAGPGEDGPGHLHRRRAQPLCRQDRLGTPQARRPRHRG